MFVVQQYHRYVCCFKGLLNLNSLRYGPSIRTTLPYTVMIQHLTSAGRYNGIGTSCWLEPAMRTRSKVTGEGLLCRYQWTLLTEHSA